MPSWVHVTASTTSSIVPKPPGMAMKASASSDIRALRSCMDETTWSSVNPSWATSSANRSPGMTPTTSPPAARAASATAPMSPTEAPP